MFANERYLRGGHDIEDWKVSYVPTISSMYLPNFSYKAEIVASSEKCFYDNISQKILRKDISKRFQFKISKALDIFLLYYVKLKFKYWYNRINRNVVNRKYPKYYYPKLISDNVTDIWPYRKGLQIIVGYVYEIYCKKTISAFRKWKIYVRDIRQLLRKMFDKWSIKASQIILSRMNAKRFLYLTRNLNKKIKYSLYKYYWNIFRYSCDLVLIRRHVRLLFRCWHTVVQSILKGRKLIKKHTLHVLRDNQYHQLLLKNSIEQKCLLIRNRYSLIGRFHTWYKLYQKYKLLKRVFIAYSYSELNSAWCTWVYKVRLTTHPVEVKPVVLHTPSNKPPLNPTTVSSYKRRGSRLPRVPPHIVVPLLGLQSYAMVHDPNVTPIDRIQYRLHRAAKLSTCQEERRVPVEVEDIRASLQDEQVGFATPTHSVVSKTIHYTSSSNNKRSSSTSSNKRSSSTPRSNKSTTSNAHSTSTSHITARKPIVSSTTSRQRPNISTPIRPSMRSTCSSSYQYSTSSKTNKVKNTPSYSSLRTTLKTPFSSKIH